MIRFAQVSFRHSIDPIIAPVFPITRVILPEEKKNTPTTTEHLVSLLYGMQNASHDSILWRKAMFVCGIVLGCFSCIVGLFPQFGVARSLSVYLPFAQVLAFPQALGLVILLLGGCATGVGWRRRWSRLALTSCLVWIVAGAGFLFAPNGIPHQVSGQQHSTVTEGNLTVVTLSLIHI